MRFAVIVYDPVHMTWVIPVDGDNPLTTAMSVTEQEGLIRPVMVIDYEEQKAWRVGVDEEGWYLSDSAEIKMGRLTQPEHIERQGVAPMDSSCT
jgi:hypothetical protein